MYPASMSIVLHNSSLFTPLGLDHPFSCKGGNGWPDSRSGFPGPTVSPSGAESVVLEVVGVHRMPLKADLAE